jgi:hypothetical protein
MVFSSSSDNTGIVEQIRAMCRVDSSQWPTARIVNSTNNYHDFLIGYFLAKDKRFNWDDTNHSKLPIGTTAVTGASDYSFTTDEQNNKILNLLRIEYIDANSNETKLEELDEMVEDSSIGAIETGQPTGYYKIADNVIRLNLKPTAGTLRFYFQRTGSYFVATDTTKEPGTPAILHRGYVIAGAYDCALTLGLNNLQPLSVERDREEQKVIRFFESRNNDVRGRITPNITNCR